MTLVHLLFVCPDNAEKRLRFGYWFGNMSGFSVLGAAGPYIFLLASRAAYFLFAEHCAELLDSSSSQGDEDEETLNTSVVPN